MEPDRDPWRTECPLDESIVRAVLRGQFPALSLGRVAYLHEGWDSRAFVVDGEWIFRFPKRREVEGWLLAERRVLERLATHALSVEIPRPEFFGVPSESFPFSFMGYRLIRGTPADAVNPDSVHRDDCARRLGSLLGLIHSFGEEGSRDLELRSFPDEPREDLEELAGFRDPIASNLPDDLKAACLPFLDGTIDVPPPATDLRLSHGDLLAEHILIADDGTLAGVIDWGDVCLADPAGDFAGLLRWLGPSFARLVLDAYPRATAPDFWDRITFRSRRLTLVNLGWALRDARLNLVFALRSVRSAFGTG